MRKELLIEKKEKNALDLKVTTQNKEFSDLKNKSHEYGQRITDLEDEVKEKAKTVKVKDGACMNFKNKKEESENRLNEVLTELNSLTSNISNILKCPFCDMKSNNRVKLSCHMKAYHCTDDMCQTDDIIVKHEVKSVKSCLNTIVFSVDI